MKGINTILGAAAAAALLSLSFGANAQENGNRDENNKIVRGAYETNGAWDNWFVGLGAGVNSLFDGSNKTGINGFALDVNAGKWFTPSVGARFGYKGLTDKVNLKDGYTSSIEDAKFGEHYIHGDLMWNISNAFSGYKETRTWDVIPYLTGGLLYNKAKDSGRNAGFAAGAGILNDFRISKRVDLFLDIQGLVFDDKQLYVQPEGCAAGLITATAGVIVNLGKTNFNRHSSVTPVVIPVPFTTDQYNALKDKCDALEKENAALRAKIDSLEAAKPDTVYAEAPVVASGATLYFDCGQTTLSEREKAHLEYYASQLAKDAKVTVTGSADNATGSAKRNQYLSEKRAEYVAKILTDKYGLDKDNITVVAEGSTNNIYDTPAKNRVVTVK